MASMGVGAIVLVIVRVVVVVIMIMIIVLVVSWTRCLGSRRWGEKAACVLTIAWRWQLIPAAVNHSRAVNLAQLSAHKARRRSSADVRTRAQC